MVPYCLNASNTRCNTAGKMVSGLELTCDSSSLSQTLRSQTGCRHRASDVTTDEGVAPLEPEFERTRAFRWLSKNAGRFGFALSFPADNPYGYDYEPWHWCFRV